MKTILVFGDSILQKVEFESSLEFNYVCESYPGSLARDFATRDLYQFEASLKAEKPNILVLCLGTNDKGHGLLDQDIVDSLKTLQTFAQDKYKVEKVIVCMLHRDWDSLNDLIEATFENISTVCDAITTMTEAELEEDGFHLNSAGKEILAASVEDLVQSMF